MITLKHGGRLLEASADGNTAVFTWQGSEEEMQLLFEESVIGVWNADAGGKLTNRSRRQEEGPVWICELTYNTSPDGDYADSPDFSFGKKSASLRGGLLSLPLATASNYRANWEYALYCAPGYKRPTWWATAKSTELSDINAQNYLWARVGEEHSDARGKWRCIPPVKPGVEYREVATYTVVESARFGNLNAAGKMVKNKLNTIGKPENDFTLGGEWKCDDVSVQWAGEYWLATLTWTRAIGTWDGDLYD